MSIDTPKRLSDASDFATTVLDWWAECHKRGHASSWDAGELKKRLSHISAISQAISEPAQKVASATPTGTSVDGAISTFLQEVIDAMNGDGPAFTWRDDSDSDALDYLGIKAEWLLRALSPTVDYSEIGLAILVAAAWSMGNYVGLYSKYGVT